MGTDLPFVAGALLVLLALPSLVAALIGARSFLPSLFLGILGAGLVGYAVTTNPTGYRVADLPEATLRVIAWVIR